MLALLEVRSKFRILEEVQKHNRRLVNMDFVSIGNVDKIIQLIICEAKNGDSKGLWLVLFR